MTVQRMFSTLGLAAAAAHGTACGMVGHDDPRPDAAPPLAHSCKELLDGDPSLDSGAFTLATAAGVPYQAYCDMVDDGGGWTLVVKADGNDPGSQFSYDSALWTNTATLRDQQVDTSRTEAKYRAFTEVGFSSIRLVMQEMFSTAMTLDVAGTSFMSLMRGPFIHLSRTRADWMQLIPDATIQAQCNQGGINNFVNDPYVRVRIGLLGNSAANCGAPDSFLGVGGGGGGLDPCYTAPGAAPFVPPSAGAISGGTCTDMPGAPVAPDRPAFAYLYVR